MGKIILVTGGARSGKSLYAEKICLDIGGETAYIATAISFDQEMEERIDKHRQRRAPSFHTIERYKDFKGLDETYKKMIQNKESSLIDCVTVMVTNIIMDYLGDKSEPLIEDTKPITDMVMLEVRGMVEFFKTNSNCTVIVTNELGMGIVPENFFSRLFRDVAGLANQYIASNSDEAYLCISGISFKIK